MTRFTTALALLLPALVACNGGDGGGDTGGGAGTTTGSGAQPPASSLFGPSISTLVIEIDYAAGAEPYTGSAGTTNDVWDISSRQMDALFEPSGTAVDIPHQLSEMELLDDVEPGDYGFAEIRPIAEAHRDLAPLSGSQASLYVVFIDGYFKDDNGRNEGVLGVSFGNTGIIAMFKPVIEGTSIGPLQGTARFVEQATLVHEIGHAVGLVNNGLPLTSQHHDEENGAHCTNQDCIMNWTIEGTSGAIDYVTENLTSGGNAILWGQECLDDAAAVSN